MFIQIIEIKNLMKNDSYQVKADNFKKWIRKFWLDRIENIDKYRNDGHNKNQQ